MSNTSTGASADAGAVEKKVEVTVPASVVVPQVAETVKVVGNVVVKVEDAAVSKVEDVNDDMHDLSHFKLTEAEIRDVVADVIAKRYRKANAEEREKIRKDYDTDIDGNIHHAVMDKIIAKEKATKEANIRYAGYTSGFARAFRYLAFTSDFGEALRPVVTSRIVTATYGVAIGYCVTDVAYEAYKLRDRGYVTEDGRHVTMTQCVLERSVFQAVASIAIPTLVVHSTVDAAKHITRKLDKFKRWGPSIAGLCVIPLLPLCIDEPVEHFLEWGFERYGPWAHK